jgi:uncharacterized membrane-anchored protein YhcB (DUF1043 family)
MWFLIPIAGLVVAGIVALVSEEEASARSNWENKYQGAKDEVENLRRNIESHLSETRSTYDFYVLNEYYYSSFRFADNAYKLLNDSRTSLSSLKKMIDAANEKRREISVRLESKMSREAKTEHIGELRNLTEFRDALQQDFNKVLAQKRDFADEVTRLNQQTEKLKTAMHERCGSKGREWYANLQQRISSRRHA